MANIKTLKDLTPGTVFDAGPIDVRVLDHMTNGTTLLIADQAVAWRPFSLEPMKTRPEETHTTYPNDFSLSYLKDELNGPFLAAFDTAGGPIRSANIVEANWSLSDHCGGFGYPQRRKKSMSNSPLVTYSRISPNRTSPRNHKIDTITIHCIVGQWTAKQGCDYFATTGRECSANYVVGKDGSIGLSVEEKDRSWCSSSRANDNRAVTIEVASDTKHPYKVTDQALAALIDLLVDICRRNGIEALLWKGDKSLIGQVDKQNMTVHRWFANKACPGDYLYNLHPQIAAQVNERLGAAEPAEPEKKPSQTPSGATFTPYLVRITASVLNIRKGPGTTYAVTGQIKDRGVYTIVEQKGNWGRLKSGAGWISLSYTKKV